MRDGVLPGSRAIRILLAPDKFKGTFSALEVSLHLREGILSVAPSAEVDLLPQADGGEGTLEILLKALPGKRVEIPALDPLGRPHRAPVGKLPDGRVVIESSLFCGLGLVPGSRRDPTLSSTYGLGLALREVLAWDPPEILLGLGGSVTVDGGLGLARALGYRLLDGEGRLLEGRGADLDRLRKIEMPDPPPLRPAGSLRVLCDVMNPLTGPRGAATLFGPQKGATAKQVEALERGLCRYLEVAARDLGRDASNLAGGGAAGGSGAGLFLFASGKIERGAETIGDITGLPEALEAADLVVTGEGRVDAGTDEGKVVAHVVGVAREKDVPAIVVCGDWLGPAWAGVEIMAAGKHLGTEELVNAGKTLALQWFS